MKTRASRGIQAIRSMKAAQVGQILGVSSRTINRLAHRGDLLGFRPSGPDGSWRFTESSVQHFLESRERAQQDAIRRRTIRTVSPPPPSGRFSPAAPHSKRSPNLKPRLAVTTHQVPNPEGSGTNSDKEGTA